MFGKGKIVKLVVTTAVSIASHIQLFKEALENKLDDKFHRDNWALSLDSTCATRFLPPPLRSHKIYGTFENSSIALDSSRLHEATTRRKKREN
jgi:hypothetical protein